MIRHYQTCFITGKNTLEGVASAYEIIHHYKKIRLNGYILKLDFEKAYDIVDMTVC